MVYQRNLIGGVMFIYSFRASTLKFFGVIALTLAILVTAIAVGQSGALAVSADVKINFGGIETNEERVAFIKQFGVNVSGEAKESVSFTVPENFDSVIAGYNELQRSQGLDIAKYKNKKVTRYTYEAVGYGDYDGTVYVNLLIYKNSVVACDVSSSDPTGFVAPLVKLN